MSQKQSSLFMALMLAAMLPPPRQPQRPMDDGKAVDKKPLHRVIECPHCGSVSIAIRSTTEDGSPMLDVHFLMEDGYHMVAGAPFPDTVSRDEYFMQFNAEKAHAMFEELMLRSVLGDSFTIDANPHAKGARW